MMTANTPLQIMDAAATRAALPFGRLIPALREQFVAGCEVPARHVHRIANAAGDELTSLLMPAWTTGPGGFYGVKIINVAPANAARGLPALHASYLLHEAATGRPLALIDGDELAARWRGAGFDAHAVAVLEPALRVADIVSCATLSTEPLVHGGWLGAGSHLDLIGSFTPAMREADDDCLRGAAVYADTEEALAKSGDLLGPIELDVFAPADLRGTLATLCRSQVVGRRSDAERSVFKSVGTALEDLAAAVLAHGPGSTS